jgi:hypothetical protein
MRDSCCECVTVVVNALFADSRIAMLILHQEQAATLQDKYTSDLGQVTVDSDREAHNLRKQTRFLQDQINNLQARMNSMITGNQELSNELNRYKLQTKDLTLEKMENEIEIERLRMQLDVKNVYTGASSAPHRVASVASSVEGCGGGKGKRRDDGEDLNKLPSVMQKMTEGEVVTKGFDTLRRNDDLGRDVADAIADVQNNNQGGESQKGKVGLLDLPPAQVHGKREKEDTEREGARERLGWECDIHTRI